MYMPGQWLWDKRLNQPSQYLGIVRGPDKPDGSWSLNYLMNQPGTGIIQIPSSERGTREEERYHEMYYNKELAEKYGGRDSKAILGVWS